MLHRSRCAAQCDVGESDDGTILYACSTLIRSASLRFPFKTKNTSKSQQWGLQVLFPRIGVAALSHGHAADRQTALNGLTEGHSFCCNELEAGL